MQYKATQELLGGHRHFALLAAVGVVLPTEADFPVGDIQNPMIGNDDAVGDVGLLVGFQPMAGDPVPRETRSRQKLLTCFE
jgi:hypothetical protein